VAAVRLQILLGNLRPSHVIQPCHLAHPEGPFSTRLSPLQYQKRLRLQEARRLMLGAGLDAAEAGFRVGYESPSQFSREYRRMFGAPPRQDVAALKIEAQPTT